MDGLPYWKFYTDRWLAGNIQAHDMETQGIFINVCSRVWANGGEVEYKVGRLAGLLRVDKQVLADAIQLLLDDDLLILTDEGNLSSKFILLQLEERNTLSKKRAKAGRKGGKAKHLTSSGNSQANAKQKLPIDSTSNSSSDSPEKGDSKGDRLAAFERCWKAYPKKSGSKDRARKAFLEAKVDEDVVINGIHRYTAFVQQERADGFTELKYADGATWFYQRRWETEYEVVASHSTPSAKAAVKSNAKLEEAKAKMMTADPSDYENVLCSAHHDILHDLTVWAEKELGFSRS